MTTSHDVRAAADDYTASSPRRHDPDPLLVVDAAGTQRLRRALGRVRICLAAGWLVVVVSAALLADILPLGPRDGDACSPSCVNMAAFQNWSEPFGTDQYGRSVLTRVVYGARVSLAAGTGAVVLALIVGLLLGMVAGYFRGWVDTALGLIIDAALAFPALIILIALAATLQPGLGTVVLGLALVSFPPFARLARAATLRHASSNFVRAARGLGARPTRVILRDIMPLVLREMAAYAGVIGALLILAESSLSFLGLGVPPPQPTWGTMIQEGLSNLRARPHEVFVPAGVLFLTIFALNVVADALRQRVEASVNV